MRDIALAIVIAWASVLAMAHPWVGAMLWTWVSLMSPHYMTYGFMMQFPVSMLAGLVTLIGMIFSRDPKQLPVAAVPVLLLFWFTLWMVVTFFFSLGSQAENLNQLDKVLKINLFILVSIALLWTRRQVDILIAVCCFSIAYFGIKGGVFTVATGGSFHVRGYGGFIAGNNEIALALVMVVPLLYYFIAISTRRIFRYALWAAIVLTVVAAVGTQSRGGLLAVAAMGLAVVTRSHKPLKLLAPAVALAVFIAIFMPDSWWERMQTIGEYSQDESAMGRINAWTVAWNVATHNFFGGGFSLESQDIFDRYAPNPAFIAVAHSIYFQVLGQHGFIGLFLYLAFWASTWRTCRWVAANSPSHADQVLARMIEVSLIGFAAGGAFLNMAYFDGPYYLMAAMVVLRYKILKNKPHPMLKRGFAAAPPGDDRSPSQMRRP